MEYLPKDRIDSYVKTNSAFVDFSRFEGDAEHRSSQKESFMNGDTYVPEYDYPKLDSLHDADVKGAFLKDKKRITYEAILELEANKESGVLLPEEYGLYAAMHEVRLKRIMLTESAHRLRMAGASAEQRIARQEFMALNHEIYGNMDVDAFEGIMSTEQQMVASFVPGNERASQIQATLAEYFQRRQFETDEPDLLDPELQEKLRDVINDRYGHILEVVPATDDDTVYDAQGCQEIMQAALQAGGLADEGWVVEINPAKSNPTTNVTAKKILLPADTQRTAAQLRRLILHEQEVHARRGYNGDETGVSALKKGTADYADVEEGLGVFLECIEAGSLDNQSYHRARDRYITAGLALGTDGTPRDARGTYELMWRLLAVRSAEDGNITEDEEMTAKKLAMTHVENAFRGTNFAMPGVIYAKLKVYYEGLKKNAEYFSARQDDLNGALDAAMRGKYNHTDPVEIETVDQLTSRAQMA